MLLPCSLLLLICLGASEQGESPDATFPHYDCPPSCFSALGPTLP